MKLFRSVSIGLGLFALASAMLVPFSGCEHGDTGATFANNGTLSLNPSSYTFGSSLKTSFDLEVEGGTPPYQWSVSDRSCGSLSGVPTEGTETTSATKATYKRTIGAYGYNTVTVTDSQNWSARCTIKVKEDIDL